MNRSAHLCAKEQQIDTQTTTVSVLMLNISNINYFGLIHFYLS